MKTQKKDFTFKKTGYGHYNVSYQSPITGKNWNAKILDMELIDATKNEDTPKRKDLNQLKRICKALTK
jgi:hypothetical protein